MSDKIDIEKIRNKIKAYEADYPGFDELFGDELPGEARLRNAFQSKLDSYEGPVPSFEELMKGKRPGVIPLYKRLIPLWGVAAAAAACIAVFLLMPDRSKMNDESLSLLKNHYTFRQSHMKHAPALLKDTSTFFTQMLETPKNIKKVPVVSGDYVDGETSSNDANTNDSAEHETYKISPSKNSTLAVNNDIEAVYALARAERRKHKRDKVLAGISFNSANRLLSYVNTRQGDEFPLQVAAKEYTDGLNWLSGVPTVSLRSAEVSKNAWKKPIGNSYYSSVGNYKATYSLPINMGLSLSIPLSGLFEVHTGITYTYLSARTTGKSEGSTTFDLHQELHYIGVPLQLAIKFHEQDRFNIYASFGGAIEKGLIGKQSFTVTQTNGKTDSWKSSQEVYGIQPVIGGQLGFSYEVAPSILLYLEPGANYYIPDDQPLSSRTEEPFNLNIGIGLRYRLK